MCGIGPAAEYSGLAVDVDRHLLYFSDQGRGQVAELELNSTADVQKRIIDSTNHSKPRSVAMDTVNRCYAQYDLFITFVYTMF